MATAIGDLRRFQLFTMTSSRWLMVVLGFLSPIAAMAQTASCALSLPVEVLEAHTHEPISGATLTLHAPGLPFLLTDSIGLAEFTGICPGIYVLSVDADGFEKNQLSVSLPLSESRFHVDLKHSSGQLLQGVVVNDRRKPLMQSSETIRTGNLRAASGKTLADALQSINGVNMLSNGGTIAKPIIHGLHSNRILILNDGVRQEDQQWGGEHAPAIDPYNAGTVTVLKGAASVRYGSDAIGGVVQVEPAALRKTPGTSGEANLGAFSNNRMGVAEASVDHVFKRLPAFSFRVQGSTRKGGNYRVPGYWAANTGLEESSYSATAAWRAAHQSAEVSYRHFSNEVGIYRGSHTGSRDDLNAAINSPFPTVPADFTYKIGRPRQHVVHDAVHAKYLADSRVGQCSAQYAYQHNYRQEHDVVRVENGKAQSNLTLNTQTLNLNLDHKPVRGFSGSIGVDGIYQNNFFAARDRYFLPFYDMVSGAAYAIERKRFGRWQTEAGLRYDYRHYSVVNFEGPGQEAKKYAYEYNSLSGTLGVSTAVRDGWTLTATGATAWRAPQPAELFSAGLHHGAARVELGNKDLQPERAYGLNLESDYRSRNEKLRLQAGLYSQYIGDFIYLEPGADLLTIRGYFRTFHYLQTDALLSGGDFSASYQIAAGLLATGKASLLRARDVRESDWLILMPTDRYSLNLRYTRSLSARFQDCYLGVEGRYVAHQRRVPRDFDAIDYPRPPDAYFLLNIEAGTTIHFRQQPLCVSLSVTNALNARYRDYLDAFRYFIDAPGTDVALRMRIPFQF